MARLLPRLAFFALVFLGSASSQGASGDERDLARQISTLRAAIVDLQTTFGAEYPDGAKFLRELDAVRSEDRSVEALARFDALRRRALLANPRLADGRILLVRRKAKIDRDLGMPTNHECNSSLKRDGYDNEIAILSLKEQKLTALYRPKDGGYVGEVDLHWDGDRLLFTQSDATNWKVFEIGADGRHPRRVSKLPEDVDAFDGCYLPDGKIVMGTTASFQSVPCWHGQKWVSNLYLSNADGSGVRQLCFDQDHDLHPTVLASGQVMYSRWDYTGINHIFMRQLMVMNPDGTGQRAVYGSNSWFPNALYFPRELPGAEGRFVCILSGYHGPNRMGQLVVVDPRHGWHEADGLVTRISGKGDPINPIVRDDLVGPDWPKFLHPWPVSDKHFLVSAKLDAKGGWGLYLADVFDNLVPIRTEPGYALLEPVLMAKRPVPAAAPDRVDPSQKDATVYLHDIYAGPGLAGVPRGTVKRLRVVGYHFGYRHLAGPDRIGIGGPWEVMRILGTVPVEGDGSAVFKVPANTPISLQPLDGEGKAVQLMRSWMTAMPGEVVSCVGCHEKPAESGPGRLVSAARRQARELEPWYGPARGFDFEREVQPVLDRYCASCHDGKPEAKLDLRPREQVKGYRGRAISDLGIKRLHPSVLQSTGGVLRYSPAYEALIGYIRRVGIEDDVSLLAPGEYHADTSPLVQLLKKKHGGVELDAEAWDRLVTWIDLNGPCHGSWNKVHAIPESSQQRRMELRRQFGGPAEDYEKEPALPPVRWDAVIPRAKAKPAPPRVEGYPFDAAEAQKRQRAVKTHEQAIDLGGNIAVKFVGIPAGRFVMGNGDGQGDEAPVAVAIEKQFWMAASEITNEQFRRFDPTHDPRYYGKRHARGDDQGLALNEPQQPVVRVSWNQAMAFCRWMSERSGKRVTLPTEAQWEWACRAGSGEDFEFGRDLSQFPARANGADVSFSRGLLENGKQITGGLEHMLPEGAALADRRIDDRFVVTAPVGSFKANAWGLFDMHGNAAEWTRTSNDEGRNDVTAGGRRIVRGGSFFDPPGRCRSCWRVSYPAWQRVFNVGFRVIVED